ncbi:MAG TPA: hypothetical protein VI386_01685 [Candidatus Sulfotelmatobacter sp.]
MSRILISTQSIRTNNPLEPRGRIGATTAQTFGPEGRRFSPPFNTNEDFGTHRGTATGLSSRLGSNGVNMDDGNYINNNGERAMTVYQGEVKRYGLLISTPHSQGPTKSFISLDMEAVGTASLNFVPQGGTLGTNQKRPGTTTPLFDIWYWMDSWPHFVDTLRNEKPVFFVFNDSLQAASLKTGWEPTGEAE